MVMGMDGGGVVEDNRRSERRETNGISFHILNLSFVFFIGFALKKR